MHEHSLNGIVHVFAVFSALAGEKRGAAARLVEDYLAGTLGLATGALAFAMLTRAPAFPPISAFHLAQSKPGAGGTNAVNTIIVDFRGYDTMGEAFILITAVAGTIVILSGGKKKETEEKKDE